jgi:hypothetical protein
MARLKFYKVKNNIGTGFVDVIHDTKHNTVAEFLIHMESTDWLDKQVIGMYGFTPFKDSALAKDNNPELLGERDA